MKKKPHADNYDVDDRRRDSRHSIPGTEIKVRKHHFSGLGRFEPCVAVDFSENGLSFICRTLDSELLDKLDFVLSLSGRSVNGSALICHKENTEHGPRFGLLFINTNEDVTHLVDPGVFANLEINLHAERAAELAASELGHSHTSVTNSRQWHQLANAVDAFVRRISDIVRDKSQTTADYHVAKKAIQEFIKIDNEARTVCFRYSNIVGDEKQAVIRVVALDDGSVEYQIGDLKNTSSVQEVIDVIGRAFVDLYKNGFSIGR